MASTAIEVLILRFAAFELDVRSNQLRRGGVLLKLSPQQFRLLRFLAEHPGQVCSREDIQQEIWGSEVFVDFDRGLNVCIAQIRATLNDDSESPRFIQTVPRRGYRFLAPVEQVTSPVEPERAPVYPLPPRRSKAVPVAAVTALVCIAAMILLWAVLRQGHRTMLAVLPFENLTQHAEDGPVIDGLVDELITQLGTIEPAGLGVIGRTSVMRYAGRKPGLGQIGRELGVDYVLEGTLRSEGDRLRVSVRLVKVADQAQVWSDAFEHEGPGRIQMQEDTSARVARAAADFLVPHRSPARVRAHNPDREAYEAFVNGRYLLRKNTRVDSERAIAWFQQAGNRDPAFAEPWAAMAETYVGLAMSGAVPGAEAYPKARTAAERALRAGESAEAHTALADVSFWHDWNWNQARIHFERAIAINPSLAQTRHDYAFYLVAMGRTEAGLASLRQAIAMDPLSPHVNLDAGWLLLQAHHFDEAIRQAKRALELEPGWAEANGCIGRALAYQGKAGPDVMEFYRRVAQGGNSYYRSLAQALLGHPEEALRELDTAYTERSTLMPLVGTEPAFAGLHGNARFREIVKKVGLPE